MRSSNFGSRVLIVFALSLCVVFSAFAQTSTTGRVVGTVTDQSGALVPGAEVELLNTATNAAQAATTDASGGYIFASVNPGIYKITIKMRGFRTATLTDLIVEVNKSSDGSIHLEVGGDKEVVEVSATAAAQLQTTDSQVGNVLSTDSILRLPTLQRNATELMNLQPATVTGGNGLAMRVAGGLDDQNTVTLDGLDITQSVVAGNTVIPTPADSVEEFRAGVSNPNANFDRASGANVTLIGRHGTNGFHGALYEYLQNSDLNSNTEESNRSGLPRPIIHDNRFGGRIGGPIQKNKTFFFANYEGRRFQSASQVTRSVPTDTLKQGILEFKDANGNIQQFNLKSAAVCGAAGNSVCDPRGLGISPAVLAQWKLMPEPNYPGGAGDGLNTNGYLAIIPTPIQTDYGVIRLDHTFNEKLSFNGNYTYFRNITTGSGDISIVNGNAQSVIQNPQRGQVIGASVNYQMTPTMINTARFGYVRDRNAADAYSPTKAAAQLNIPGSQTADGNIALLIGSGVSSFIDSPIDMDTQRARYQENWNGQWQYQDDVNWVHGKHSINFGAQINMLPYTHARADKVVGSISSLVATVDGDQGFISIPSADRPVTCGGAVTTNCLKSADLQNWDRYYASALGMVDNVNVLAVRGSNLQPLPLGTNIVNHTNQWATYFYLQDSWRVKPTLTITAGLSYGWQSAPTESNGLQTLMINASSGQPLDAISYMNSKLQAALAGQIFEPTIGFEPVANAHRSVYNVDWGDLGPRVAVAWNPSVKSGFLSKIMGDRKTVIRGGFSIFYDRSNTVQSVEIPMLGVGFDQTIIVQGPLCNATGVGGAGCAPASGNPGTAAFRVGVDGSLPLPVPTAVTSPIIPPQGQNSETLSFQVDPNTKVGRSFNTDLSIQRELPGNVIIEATFIGRNARRLPEAINLNQSPYMFVDSASGESFAQAFDAVGNALRAGQTPATQPWFENQLPGLAAANKSSGTSTAFIAGSLKSSFTAANVSNLFFVMDTYRRQLGLLPYNNDQAEVEFMRTYIGDANYNAGALTITKRFSRGFTVIGNYTYSKALDNGISNQNSAGFYSNNFHPGVDYGPSSFDRRHVLNAIYRFEIPAGKGHNFHTGNFVDQIIGGWYTSGIVTAYSGSPLTVSEGNNTWGAGLLGLPASTAAVPLGPLPATSASLNSYNTSCTSAGSNAILQGGSGMNIFSNPCAALADFGYLGLASATRTGRGDPMYGLPFWNFDMSFGKSTAIKTGDHPVNLLFSGDLFNAFNHPNWSTPSPSLTNPNSFGVLTGTVTPPNRTVGARWIEFGMRLEF